MVFWPKSVPHLVFWPKSVRPPWSFGANLFAPLVLWPKSDRFFVAFCFACFVLMFFVSLFCFCDYRFHFFVIAVLLFRAYGFFISGYCLEHFLH